MTVKINAAARLRATSLKADWFDDLGPEDKKSYVKLHPASKHAENYDNAQDAKEDRNKAKNKSQDKSDHIAETKKAINDLIDDIKDIEGDGEDASRERAMLKEYRADLAELLHP